MRVVAVSGSRADYGILEPLLLRMQDDPFFELIHIVTGDYYRFIDDIKIKPYRYVDICLKCDSATAISKSMGLCVISFSEVLKDLTPCALLVLGDRYEIFSAVSVANIFNIPVIHLHGGEVTQGSYDDSFRHAITKMSHIHLVAAEPYAKRVIQMGESNVFNVGALGCDGLVKRKEQPEKPLYVVVYHPETVGNAVNIEGMIEKHVSGKAVYIQPGYDKGCSEVGFANSIPHLSRDSFLDLLANATAIIGNSSSGIIEAPALGVPTINIGNRQSGRLMAASIITCGATQYQIDEAFDRLGSDVFKSIMNLDYYCPYGGGNVAETIISMLKRVK